MKIVNTILTLVVACAVVVTAHASAAPILLVDGNGILIGAKNVTVAGSLYNVSIMDGSCDSVFDGCDNASFTFTTHQAAAVAGLALLDQILLDSPLGRFDSEPNRVSGCTNRNECFIAIPYLSYFYLDGTQGFDAYSAYNTAPSYYYPDNAGWISTSSDNDTAALDWVSWARFELVVPFPTEVPEPSSVALFGLAMAGLAFNRRKA